MSRQDDIAIGYENLANAIIVEAARDYKTVYKKIMASRDKPRDRDTAEDCESFFEGEWIKCLTSVDGYALMHMVRGQAVKEMRNAGKFSRVYNRR